MPSAKTTTANSRQRKNFETNSQLKKVPSKNGQTRPFNYKQSAGGEIEVLQRYKIYNVFKIIEINFLLCF